MIRGQNTCSDKRYIGMFNLSHSLCLSPSLSLLQWGSDNLSSLVSNGQKLYDCRILDDCRADAQTGHVIHETPSDFGALLKPKKTPFLLSCLLLLGALCTACMSALPWSMAEWSKVIDKNLVYIDSTINYNQPNRRFILTPQTHVVNGSIETIF